MCFVFRDALLSCFYMSYLGHQHLHQHIANKNISKGYKKLPTNIKHK
jgi:hypothetical protein